MKNTLLLLFFLFANSVLAALQPVSLTVELQESPLLINSHTPHLGWKLTSDDKNLRQSAYQISVINVATKENVWNSGKVKSAQNQHIKYAGKNFIPANKYQWTVTVWDSKGRKTVSKPAFFETAPAFLSNTQWIGAITRADANLPVGRRNFHSPSFKNAEYQAIFNKINPLALRSIILRKEFSVSKSISRAVIYISGLGHYKLWLNGSEASKDIFTPAWSDYDKTVYFNAFDVKDLLLQKQNTIGVMLGNGFYNAVGNRYRKLWVSFGAPTLFTELHIDYEDGTKEIVSSDNSWKYALSPITFNDIFGGEDYDAQLEQENWNTSNFNDADWKQAVIQEEPNGKLRPQQLTNVRDLEQFSAVSMTKIDSSFVFDMGQNLAGYPSISVLGKKGQTIKLAVGEQLDEKTGRVSQRQSGSPHTYSYTLKGDEKGETWNPEFSYYGFRYIQIDGVNVLNSSEKTLPTLTGIKSHFIYNSVKNIGTFECSNTMFNKVHTLIQNAVKSNMQAVFTDCPHREKLGWLEETHLVNGALLYSWDMSQFYPKIMQDIADAQLPNGLVPTTAPEYTIFAGPGMDVFRDSPEWGIAALMLPKLYYDFYGDKTLIDKYFDVMKRYVDYLSSRAENYILDIGLGDWYDYGEHRAGFSKNSPVNVSATAHYFYAAHLLVKAAEISGRKSEEKEYKLLENKIRDRFNEQFFNSDTKQYANGSQFCNAVAIFMNIVEEKSHKAVLENLKANIAAHGNRLTTGDVGNRYLFMALALNGENELMYTMHNHEEVPGYGYQLKFGATTLTEQWDPRHGASWNHFMMGQIDEWFFRSLAGIEPISAGFKTFSIKPQPVGDLTYVKSSFETIYGSIKVHWTKTDNKFTLHLTVPANTTAQVTLPNGKEHNVGGGEWEWEVVEN